MKTHDTKVVDGVRYTLLEEDEDSIAGPAWHWESDDGVWLDVTDAEQAELDASLDE